MGHRVQEDADMKQFKAKYQVLENTNTYILIEDLSNDDPYAMSITNVAEEVVDNLISCGILTADKRLFYIDTMGQKDELAHNGEEFLGFKSG